MSLFVCCPVSAECWRCTNQIIIGISSTHTAAAMHWAGGSSDFANVSQSACKSIRLYASPFTNRGRKSNENKITDLYQVQQ